MKIQIITITLALCASEAMTPVAMADDEIPEKTLEREEISVYGRKPEFLIANARGPIGQMGDHMHEDGEWMLSYRYMHMAMAGNRLGTSDISNETIVTTIANPFAAMPMMPPTLRVVPEEMTMKMHMMGVMYGPNRDLTLMIMAMHHEKEMSHTTYMGGAGTTVLGSFTARASGWADTKLSVLYRLHEDPIHDVHVSAGVSIPTGSVTKTAEVLTPMGATPTLRMPYAMQLGSGSYDFEPGITYNGHQEDWAWSLFYRGVIRIDENDEGYAFGDKHVLGANVSYLFAPWVSGSLGLAAKTEGSIDGMDPLIMAPVQTADPNNYGGERIDLSLGLNFSGTITDLPGHRFGIELSLPVYEDLNGPQMKSDFTLIAGYQYDF